jgi:hypothetical protein
MKRRYQHIVSVLMGYATYLVVVCPCEKTLSCHMQPFFLSVGAASALVLLENNGRDV